jgi:hypothetical protein
MSKKQDLQHRTGDTMVYVAKSFRGGYILAVHAKNIEMARRIFIKFSAVDVSTPIRVATGSEAKRAKEAPVGEIFYL